jgi:hypothetical protein
MLVRSLFNMRAPDNLKGHYEAMVIQPIEYIHLNNIDFCSGNIIKYASRWNRKGDPVGDLLKIIDYATILLKQQEREDGLVREDADVKPMVYAHVGQSNN